MAMTPDRSSHLRLIASPRVDGEPPPHDLQLEESLVAAALIHPELAHIVATDLRPEHFYSGEFTTIFRAIQRMVETNEPVDAVTVMAELKARNELDRVGGPPEILRLTATLNILEVRAYARRLRDLWRVRRGIYLCQEHVANAYARAYEDPVAGTSKVGHALVELAQIDDDAYAHRNGDCLRDVFTAKKEQAAADGGPWGLGTGLHALDVETGGLHQGQLTIVGARPAVGKSALALQVARAVAESGKAVAFFSMEMTRAEVLTRVLSQMARIPSDRILRKSLSPEEQSRLVRACNMTQQLPLYIEDSGRQTIDDIRRRTFSMLHEAERQSKLIGLVVVDYLQLVAPTKERLRAPLFEHLSDVSRALKTLAVDFGVPVIGVAQLNRDVDKRSGEVRWPKLADLKGSGSIEADANNVWLLHREGSADDGRERFDPSGRTHLICAKQRGLPTFHLELQFDGPTTSFGEMR